MTGKHHPPKHHIKYCSCQWNHVKSYWKTIWNSSSSIIKHKVIVGIECHRTSPISILLLSLSPSLPPSLSTFLSRSHSTTSSVFSKLPPCIHLCPRIRKWCSKYALGFGISLWEQPTNQLPNKNLLIWPGCQFTNKQFLMVSGGSLKFSSICNYPPEVPKQCSEQNVPAALCADHRSQDADVGITSKLSIGGSHLLFIIYIPQLYTTSQP